MKNTYNYKIFVILFATSVIFLGYGAESFTSLHTTQSNALASYNNTTNQISVDWNFNTLDPGTRCAIKADFNFNDNINTATDTSVNHFIPTYYSTVSSTPVLLDAINNPGNGYYGEEINCSESFKIDVDTILNHPTNTQSLIGFDAFITFYILNDDGEFSISNNARIDELYVLYDPVNVVNQSTIDYACGTNPPNPQIGNVLYIDASGSNGSIAVHTNNAGNNSANCSEYIYTDSEQWVDISDAGVISSGNHPQTYSLLIEVVWPSVVSTVGGGGCSGDCQPPTLGIDENGQRVVTDGFTYNGYSVDVERFFTPYPLITVNIGEQNKAEFKIFENSGTDSIKHFSLAFGLDKNQMISISKVMIELDIDFDGTETIIVTDPQNVLDDVRVETIDKVDCNGEPEIDCLQINIYHTFRAPLDFDIVATDVWDNKRNAWQNYYNHGIEVVGKSLNPPDEYFGSNRGHIYHLTETDKDTAVDESGNTWSFEYGIWNKDYIASVPIVDAPTDVMTRTHSEFKLLQQEQIILALNEMHVLCPTCLLPSYDDFEDSFAYEFPQRLNSLDKPEIQSLMKYEEQKAKEHMEMFEN